MDPTTSASRVPISSGSAWRGRILHPTDFSPESELAFVHALKLALAARGDFSIVHIDLDRDPGNNAWTDFPAVRERLAAWNLLEPGAPSAAVADQLHINVRKFALGCTNALEGVLGLLKRHPTDMVVLANRTYEGVDRWRHASVSEPLARKTGVPTLFLPQGARGFVDPVTGDVRLRRILIPVDDRPGPEEAMILARTLADGLGAQDAEITLLHVGEDWPSTLGAPKTDGYGRLEKAGPVVDAILEAADEIEADLIVMATAGHDGILDALRGSTTEQVLRRARRALIAVPAS